MKTRNFFLAMLAVMLVSGFAFVSCGGENNNATKFEGTWLSRDPSNPTGNYNRFIFSGNNYSYIAVFNGQTVPGSPMSGTFTYTDTVIVFSITNGPTLTRTYTFTNNGIQFQEFGFFLRE